MSTRTPPGLPEADRTVGRQTNSSARDERITSIIAEFSEVFAFARTRWLAYANDVHPDLKGVGLIVLQTILKRGPVTATVIAQHFDMDKAVVSRQIAKLREIGLVSAEPSSEDGRVTLLTATETAQRLLAEIQELWAGQYHERFADWSVHDLDAFATALGRFNAPA